VAQAAYVEQGRLGGDAWQQGGRFRRAPGLRGSDLSTLKRFGRKAEPKGQNVGADTCATAPALIESSFRG